MYTYIYIYICICVYIYIYIYMCVCFSAIASQPMVTLPDGSTLLHVAVAGAAPMAMLALLEEEQQSEPGTYWETNGAKGFMVVTLW